MPFAGKTCNIITFVMFLFLALVTSTNNTMPENQDGGKENLTMTFGSASTQAKVLHRNIFYIISAVLSIIFLFTLCVVILVIIIRHKKSMKRHRGKHYSNNTCRNEIPSRDNSCEIARSRFERKTLSEASSVITVPGHGGNL